MIKEAYNERRCCCNVCNKEINGNYWDVEVGHFKEEDNYRCKNMHVCSTECLRYTFCNYTRDCQTGDSHSLIINYNSFTPIVPKCDTNTLIISAFPGCGKSTYYRENSIYAVDGNDTTVSNRGKILDSDSSLFSWLYDDAGNKIGRNPDFPQNYIQHIKDCIGKEDIVFISSHDVVRKALEAERIPYVLVYPQEFLLDDFMKRFKDRGNDEAFIKFQEDNWYKFIYQMRNEKYPIKIELDYVGAGINNKLIDSLKMKLIAVDTIKDMKAEELVYDKREV